MRDSQKTVHCDAIWTELCEGEMQGYEVLEELHEQDRRQYECMSGHWELFWRVMGSLKLKNTFYCVLLY